MKKGLFVTFRAGLCLSTAAISLIATAASAQTAPVRIDLPAQSLAATLKQIGRQTNVDVLFVAGDVRGVTAPAVSGAYDADAALRVALGGSALHARRTAQGAYVVERNAGLGESNAGSAAAETGSADRVAGQSGDIIVTAQRYEQRLQDVPLSITAISAETLKATGAGSITDLQYTVPGLSLFEYGGGKTFMQMRGISQISGPPTVAIYLDETPLSGDSTGDAIPIRLLDMERVEVLRGPQATLYGEGSMGGTIRYIPAAPKFDKVLGSIEGEYNTTKDGSDGYKLNGMVNVPLSDIVAVRVVGGFERIGGYIDSPALGKKDINKTDQWTVRGIIAAQPSDQLSLSLMAMYNKLTQDNQDFAEDRVTASTVYAYNHDKATLVQGKFAYEMPFATLEGSASYQHRRNVSVSDISPFYVPLLSAPPPFGFGLPVGFITAITLPADVTYKNFASELRLGNQGEKFGWQIGGSYRNLKTKTLSYTITSPGTIPLAILDATQDVDVDFLAAYGELNYAFTPELKATAGVRYFHEKKNSLQVVTNFGATSTDVGKATFKTWNPRFNLSYDFSPYSMVYANVAKGFRGGGFNPTSAGGGVFPVPPTYAPDTVWTYEVGTKQQLFDNKLTLEASVYRSEWKNVQSYAFVPGSPLTVINNSGDVSGWGVDLAATVRPTRYLTITGTYGWNNLEFDTTTADKLPGDPVDGAVRESYSASLDFRPPLTDNVNGIFRVDYQHAKRSQLTLRNFGGQIIDRPGRDLVNLRIGAAVDQFEISLFANNVFDEDAPNIVGPFGVFTEDLQQRPRVIGIRASSAF